MFKTRQDNLLPGDYLPKEELYADAVYRDAYGVWVDWSNGDCGYVTESSIVEVERS